MRTIPLNTKTFKSKKHTINLSYPNVRCAKDHGLFKTSSPLSMEIILDNLKLCNFEVVTYGELNGSKTKVTVKCCNIECNGTCEKRYGTYIYHKRLPLCKECASIVNGINAKNKRPIIVLKDGDSVIMASTHEAARELNISQQQVYNHLMSGTPHKSGYRFMFAE
ncbi:hypothetical protein [Bacillus sp. AFS096315]|uniref:hypothetical protein n=1 Tax=Bacillus sp. AFS096315 TaxID=2033517 RepID=UPI000BEDF237|nr:hypothetical protein [Bacillus sp. AFS096315]PEC46379.1 hypothetical protein CON00_23955 [Bacillus sp. AFS096315]